MPPRMADSMTIQTAKRGKTTIRPETNPRALTADRGCGRLLEGQTPTKPYRTTQDVLDTLAAVGFTWSVED